MAVMAALKVAGSRPRSFRPQHWLMMKKQSRGVGGIRLKKVLSPIQRPKHIVSCRFTACPPVSRGTSWGIPGQ